MCQPLRDLKETDIQITGSVSRYCTFTFLILLAWQPGCTTARAGGGATRDGNNRGDTDEEAGQVAEEG